MKFYFSSIAPEFKQWPVSDFHRKVAIEFLKGCKTVVSALGKEGSI
jgi:hypothetical protein